MLLYYIIIYLFLNQNHYSTYNFYKFLEIIEILTLQNVIYESIEKVYYVYIYGDDSKYYNII